MEMKLKKLWPLVGAFCFAAVSTVSADSHYGSNSSSNGTQQANGYQRGTYREITPNAGPRVAHGADVFITADFIYWKSVQEGTGYAATGVASEPAPGGLASGKIKSVGDDFAPGFKVGLGLNLNHDGWDILAQYTWLRPSNSNSIAMDSENGLGAEQFYAGLEGNINKSTSSWDLNFNVIDLEVGRNFYLSQYLTMRPFMGLKGTWQEQEWKTKATTSGEFTPQGHKDPKYFGPVLTDKTMKNWALGVRGGFNLGWYFTKCWSFYSNLAFSSLMTDYYEVKTKEVVVDGENKLDLSNINNDSHFAVKYVGEVELGLRWETWFYDDSYHFSVQAGWEHQAWINWGEFANGINSSTQDMSFHGLNLKFRFDF